MRERDNPEVLLNEALNSFGDPGPNSGLEARTLARLDAFRHAEKAPALPRRNWLWLAVGLPATACAILAVMLLHHGTRPSRAPMSTASSAPTGESATANPHPAPAHRNPTIRHLTRKPAPQPAAIATASLPKAAIFPTVPPLTPEERAFLEWQRHAPESERKAFIQAQSRPDQPHDIAAIRIPPLEMPDLGTH